MARASFPPIIPGCWWNSPLPAWSDGQLTARVDRTKMPEIGSGRCLLLHARVPPGSTGTRYPNGGTTMNAVDILKYGHLTLLQALEGLPESEWTTPGACGAFSTKDLMVHMTSQEEVLADVLQTFGAGGPTPHFDLYGANPDEYGQGREARAATMSPAEVLADYHAAHDRLMDNVQ